MWDAAGRAVYWCDINRFLVHKLDIASGGVCSWLFEEPVVAMAPTDTAGWLLVACASHLLFWRPADDSRQVIDGCHLGGSELRFNDGRGAPNGDFWIGTMHNNVGRHGEALSTAEGRGALYVCTPQLRLVPHLEGLSVPNTICWSPDGGTFYFADSRQNMIWAFDYCRESGTITNRRPFFAGFERGVPDGSAVDVEGCLWNCRFGGACIVRVDPTGRVREVVNTPVSNPTNCVFGGATLGTLFVTSAALKRAPDDRLAGSLIAADVPTTGTPLHAVAIRTPPGVNLPAARLPRPPSPACD